MAPGLAEQVELIRRLVAGDLGPEEFAGRWLAARRRALEAGERVPLPLERLLDEVFFAVEDYVPQPELRDPGELSGPQLVERVRAVAGRVEEYVRHVSPGGDRGGAEAPSA
ncbi:self-protective colicin-like immunity [Amycolatopsis sacchari]|uniref:Self-protective colicin-like immunity n=1 Tax=Amycolatopsis sacchari TaxID=115433 RepID=A0A1I3MZ74_9PSEU|nr:hypothetical protein [Amycolatopsis sacchari]SFJ02271.1 self-protective colicin-like immunity [Amycolatopsis sacchari]